MSFKLFKSSSAADKEEVDRLKREASQLSKQVQKLEEKNATLETKVASLRETNDQLAETCEKQAARNRETHEKVKEFRKACGLFLPGKYYSPLPSPEDIERAVAAAENPAPELPDVEMNPEAQRSLLEEFRRFYDDLPFPDESSADFRYHYDQGWFAHADAVFYYAFLRHHRPRRIVEVGSGFSSALALDTVERFFDEKPEMTFIDPNPERLEALLSEEDYRHCRVIREPVQTVDLSVFSSLESGDLLFIDSSHVLKPGSDLPHLFFSILPRIAPGVFVHFHDIFHPFEYPRKWLEEGRFWNEAYLLRAFLAFNSDWKIHFFTSFASLEWHDFLESEMPLCLENSSGSIYLRRNPD